MSPKKPESEEAFKTKQSAEAPPTDDTAKEELEDAQLDDVTGGAGKVSMTDFSFTTKVDKPSAG